MWSRRTTLSAVVLAAALIIACRGSDGAGSAGNSGSISSGSAACQFAPRAGVFSDRWLQYSPVNATHATPAQWPYFYQPSATLGPPCGDINGTFDGVSLGFDQSLSNSQGGFLILGFGDVNGHRCAVDDGSTAPDLAVYGNEFSLGGTFVYNKIATVDVADAATVDGMGNVVATWHRFPASYSSDPAHQDLRDPLHYINFAGVNLTANGGDRFDLGIVIRNDALPANFQACYLRLTDGGTLYPDYGDTQTDLTEAGAAVDAVEALYSAANPGLNP